MIKSSTELIKCAEESAKRLVERRGFQDKSCLYLGGAVSGFLDGYSRGVIDSEKAFDIDKACNYLREHIDDNLIIYHGHAWCSLEEFISKFREFMINENKE